MTSNLIGVNLVRRHLDKGQKIALAVELEPHFAKEAKKRQDAGCVAGGHARHRDVEHGGKCPTKQKSRDQAAAAVGVSGRLVSAAKAIS